MISKEIGDRESEGKTLSNIGVVYAEQGDKAKAISFFQQSIQVKESIQQDIKVGEFKPITRLSKWMPISTWD